MHGDAASWRRVKTIDSFAIVYGAGQNKLTETEKRRYTSRVLGQWSDIYYADPATRTDSWRLEKLRALLEEIQTHTPYIEAGMQRIRDTENVLEELPIHTRQDRVKAIQKLQHELEESFAEFTRELDSLGVPIVR